MSSINFDPETGLVPGIVQDASTGQILMLGYLSEEALQKTVETGLVTFFSRSRGRLWVKGETSGNRLHYVGHKVDCDGDTLLIEALPKGPTCHTGSRTCFVDDESGSFGFLGKLESIIQSRSQDSGDESYTKRLLDRGTATIAQKVGEEATEVVVAGLSESDDRLANESADLLYHLLVLLKSRDLSLEDVVTVLRSRHEDADAT